MDEATELSEEDERLLPTILLPPPSFPRCFYMTGTELLQNESYLILLDQHKIADLRGEVSKFLYPNVPNFDELPERLTFKFEQWVNKKDKRVRLHFDDDNTIDI
eukprot:5731925-Pleurochrysis_carterae.AAC.1